MSFQAYLDTVKSKTGKEPADFRVLAEKKGLLAEGVKTTQLIDWLAADFGLGRGHAMAIIATLKPTSAKTKNPEDVLAAQFSGAKAHWRPVFDSLLERLRVHGPVDTSLTNTYVSLLRATAKFAIIAVTAQRLDIGIKLKGADPTERFEPSGSWNSMVTHRVRVTAADQLDDELFDWLTRAYDAAAR